MPRKGFGCCSSSNNTDSRDSNDSTSNRKKQRKQKKKLKELSQIDGGGSMSEKVAIEANPFGEVHRKKNQENAEKCTIF